MSDIRRIAKQEAVAIVTNFSGAIRETYQPVKVVLYGSYARGDHTAASDIDDRIEPVLLETG